MSHGNKPNAVIHPNKSSPTAAISSLYTMLALYVRKTEYQIGRVDIKGAIMQMPMNGPPVFMKLSKTVTKYAIDFFLEYKDCLLEDGIMYTRMLKAMYGCVQASWLWFELLTKILQKAGYKLMTMVECIMCHVDVNDLLILATQQKKMMALKSMLVQHFKWITMNMKDMVSYLEMQITQWDNQFEVEMAFLIAKLLQPDKALPVWSTPGTRTEYQVDENLEKLKEAEHKVFTLKPQSFIFSRVCASRYFNCGWFLCTQVTCATMEDRKKLARVLGYLKGMMMQGLVIHPVNNVQLHA